MTFFHGGRRRQPFATLSETSYLVGISTSKGGRRFRIVASFSGMGKPLATEGGTSTRLHRRLRRSRHLGGSCGAQIPSLSFGDPPKNASRSSSPGPSLPPRTDIEIDQIGPVDEVGLTDGVQGGRRRIGAGGDIGTGGDPTAEAGGDGVLILAVLKCCGPSPSLSARSWLQCSVSLSRRSSLISWWRTGLCTRRHRIAMERHGDVVPDPFVDVRRELPRDMIDGGWLEKLTGGTVPVLDIDIVVLA